MTPWFAARLASQCECGVVVDMTGLRMTREIRRERQQQREGGCDVTLALLLHVDDVQRGVDCLRSAQGKNSERVHCQIQAQFASRQLESCFRLCLAWTGLLELRRHGSAQAAALRHVFHRARAVHGRAHVGTGGLVLFQFPQHLQSARSVRS